MVEKFFEGIEKCKNIEEQDEFCNKFVFDNTKDEDSCMKLLEGILADERVNFYVDLAATIMTMEDNLYELGFDYFVFCLM